MNLFVQPFVGIIVLVVVLELSTVRNTVVPTAQIRLLSFIPVLIILEASSVIIISSESILCFERSSTSTGLKVPNPT